MDNFGVWANTCLLFLYVAAGIWILEGFDFRRLGGRRIAYPIMLAVTLAANLYALHALGLQEYLRVYPLTSFLPLFLASFLITRYRGFKVLFVFLTAAIWISPLMLTAHLVSLLLGPDPMVKFVAYAVVAVPMLMLLKRYFRAPLLYLLDNYDRGWALFCAVPLLCTCVTYYQTRYRFVYDLETFKETGIWQLTLSLLSFITYLLIVQYVRQVRGRLEAKSACELLETRHHGALQHIASLKQSRLQAALYVHDLRHHLRYIHSLAEKGDRDEIMNYVTDIQKSIDVSAPQAFCGNETVNLILSSFRAQAEKRAIAIDIRADIPEKLNVPDADLCVIISNALENAIEAADAVRDRPRIVEFNCHTRNDQLLLEIANPFSGEVQLENGAIRSDGESEGLGTRSIALVVAKHAGISSFEAQGGRFVLRIIL